MGFLAGFGTGLMNSLSAGMEARGKLEAERETYRLREEDRYQQALRDEARREYSEKKKEAEKYKNKVTGLSSAILGDGIDQSAADKAAADGLATFGESNVHKYIPFLQNYAKTGDKNLGRFLAQQEEEETRRSINKTVSILGARQNIRDTSMAAEPTTGLEQPAATPNITPASPASVQPEQTVPPPELTPEESARGGAPEPVANVQTAPKIQPVEVQQLQSIKDPAVKEIAVSSFKEPMPSHFAEVDMDGPRLSPEDLAAMEARKEEVLTQVKPEHRNTIVAVLEGRLDPNKVGNRAEVKQIYGYVTQIDPSYTTMTYDQRKQTIRDFGPNTRVGTSINALKTVTNHLDTLSKQAPELKNGDIQVWNKFANRFGIETGKTPAAVFNNIQEYLSFELARYYMGGVPTQSAIDDVKKNMGSFNSPDQLDALINTTAALVQGKVAAIDFDWKSRMGAMANFRDPVGNDTRQIVTRLAGKMGHGAEAAPAGEAAAPATKPSAKAVEMLKSNPNMIPQFEAKFGVGSAKQYLGE